MDTFLDEVGGGKHVVTIELSTTPIDNVLYKLTETNEDPSVVHIMPRMYPTLSGYVM
ncbi:MAG: hypothetical protein IKM35_05835 [Bacteroidaceae bacterium]|nr:hypothetical protein [Bacteroidaceae bacterium]